MKKPDTITILGIETSCDETAAAIVRGSMADNNSGGEILANVVLSQTDDHAPFGGVVPEIAARAHLNALDGIVQRAMGKAELGFSDLDAIAVTSGPGLAGGLIVGTMTARAIAAVHDKPLYMINHLEGHALTARLTDAVAFPYLLLLVSGGHTQILLVRGVDDYVRWATTIDDALGEAFDKTAKILGLPYPGGPQVEKAAFCGDPQVHQFPRPLGGRETMDMSYSGLKTAVRKAAEKSDGSKDAIANICASFQAAVADVLEDRVSRALEKFKGEFSIPATLVVAGGVAANSALRNRLQALCERLGSRWIAPPPALCTDNAAMIAWAGLERHRLGKKQPAEDGIRPRWPLDPDAVTRLGAGKKGAKA